MVALDVLVLPAFASEDLSTEMPVSDELRRWLDAFEFAGEVTTPAANGPLYYTDDGIGITPTGMGKAAAASTVAGILAADDIDLRDTVFVTVGVAGGAPDSTNLGSVAVADAVVDWDLKQRYSEPERVELFEYRPRDYVWELNRQLVETAAAAAEDVSLATADPATDAPGSGLPGVTVGPSVCGDEFWHGESLARSVDWLCAEYGVDGHVTTQMEDAGTATALERAGVLHRYVSVRAVTNFDRPVGASDDGERPDDGVEAAAFELGLENAFRAGTAVVEAVR